MRQSPSLLNDLTICLRFASVIPLPQPLGGGEALESLSRAIRMLPLAGAFLGALSAGALLLAASIGLPPQLSSALAIGALALLCGGLHEDGLADCADGFCGGATRARKLEIMRDSRIGVFAALTLIFSVYLRIASVTLIAQTGLALACAVLIGAAALSRAAALVPLTLLGPARQDGLGFSAGGPKPMDFSFALLLAFLLSLAPLCAGGEIVQALAAAAASVVSALMLTALARRQIGGQTGDVAGAAQQISEIIIYIVYCANP